LRKHLAVGRLSGRLFPIFRGRTTMEMPPRAVSLRHDPA
jgi:hypothetical protein